MQTFFHIAGVVTVVLLLIIAVLLAIGFIIEAINRWRQASHDRIYARCYLEIGGKLRQGAYWFSEVPAAMYAIDIMGERMCSRNMCVDTPDSARDEWRARMITAEAKANTVTTRAKNES